ncbi:conserved hypothetical protein [Paraburkholderia piptadeniae]|uniref:Zorya protein ZorC EH domain-containing protein n=1 Tax=Paraburkholderia piptadeniae TaxID=1701573 RepID=A0A1N7RWL8_9BURK|nr:EH signature domain-containing protein [Paraburkholderia piptadeniae]SIT39490.1 conserved hypothetical protein [Paraburkholderia piptadeniae]
MTSDGGIDALLVEMKARLKSGGGRAPSEDHQLDAVRRYWDSQEVSTFRDAYLLSWSLCLPHRPRGQCVLEDRPRLQGVLDGVDGYKSKTSAYRRCYQGLVKSYFTYDADAPEVPPVGRKNWGVLRDYLHDNNGDIRDRGPCPEWVDTAVENRQLFGEVPCAPYVGALLQGDASSIDELCGRLQIGKGSWFLRQLVLAQVEGATKRSHGEFQHLLPRLLALLANNEVLRDRGMIMVLDRYAQVPGTTLHPGLRDHAVAWWGNPWLPSNATRWGGVVPAARSMVAEWLKLEFIETFFTKLAEDGLGDPRRMNFWKRYVKAIDHIEFALGSFARNSREPDFITLRRKMTGLTRELDASGANNAFIMTMGKLVAVEFSGLGNALYGYDAGRSIPFDTTRTLGLSVGGNNSLKQKGRSILWLSHQDGIHGWAKWEEMFDATLRKEFGILPSAPAPQGTQRSSQPVQPLSSGKRGVGDSPSNRSRSTTESYSNVALRRFAAIHGLEVDDKTSMGGNLWVRGASSDDMVNQVLTRWGFRAKPGKGWWR